jgi:hypothetical protein
MVLAFKIIIFERGFKKSVIYVTSNDPLLDNFISGLLKEYPEVWQAEYPNPSMNETLRQLTDVPFILDLLKKKAPVKIFQMIYKYLLSGKITYTEKQAREQKVNTVCARDRDPGSQPA